MVALPLNAVCAVRDTIAGIAKREKAAPRRRASSGTERRGTPTPRSSPPFTQIMASQDYDLQKLIFQTRTPRPAYAICHTQCSIRTGASSAMTPNGHCNCRFPLLTNASTTVCRGTDRMPCPVEEPPARIRRLVILLPNRPHRKFKQLAAAKETTMAFPAS